MDVSYALHWASLQITSLSVTSIAEIHLLSPNELELIRAPMLADGSEGTPTFHILEAFTNLFKNSL